MAKSRNKSGSELEHLRGQVKYYKSLVRNLKKRLKNYEKKEHFFEREDYQDEVEVFEEYIDEGDQCPNCGKGHLEETDYKFVIVASCNLCEYNERRNPDGSKKEKVLP